MTTIVMGKDKIDHIIKLKTSGKIDSVQNVVLIDPTSDEEKEKLREADLTVFDYTFLLEDGEKNRVKLAKPTYKTIFTI